MQVQHRSMRQGHGRSISGGSLGIGYIAAGDPGLDAKHIKQRSLEQPGFLRNCERILFGSSRADSSQEIDGFITGREH